MSSRSVNKVILIGNLTRDPELRYTPQGTAVCSFGIATNRSWTTESNEKREEVEFHRIVAWNKLAELCAQLLFKGRKVYIEGRLSTRTWTGQDGTQRQTTEVVSEEMMVLDNRVQEGENRMPDSQAQAGYQPGQQVAPPAAVSAIPVADDTNVSTSATSESASESASESNSADANAAGANSADANAVTSLSDSVISTPTPSDELSIDDIPDDLGVDEPKIETPLVEEPKEGKKEATKAKAKEITKDEEVIIPTDEAIPTVEDKKADGDIPF